MAKSTKKKPKKSPPRKSLVVKTPKTWNGLEGFEFEWDEVTYWVNKFSEAGALDTVRYNGADVVIDYKDDFGGTGKNALKLVTNSPFKAWIDRFAREV